MERDGAVWRERGKEEERGDGGKEEDRRRKGWREAARQGDKEEGEKEGNVNQEELSSIDPFVQEPGMRARHRDVIIIRDVDIWSTVGRRITNLCD